MQRISIRGARQHNLKNLDLDLPRRAWITVSGVSGSGKSSLVIDTLYAEGQRRYVESLSTYTKQFLERLEKPDVDAVTGISPAIAIRQRNAVKSSRSTVGTATEVYDYLRLLFARAATPHCPGCGRRLTADLPGAAAQRLLAEVGPGARILVTFTLGRRRGGAVDEWLDMVRRAGFVRLWLRDRTVDLDPPPRIPARTRRLEVVVDRLVARPESRGRLVEALETAYRAGKGRAAVIVADTARRIELSEQAECSRCQVTLDTPQPATFSFNSPLGACPDCRGFGNRLEFDVRRIVPEPERTLAEGALAPWATPKFEYFADKLEAFCHRQRIPMNVPWRDLPATTRNVLLEGTRGFRGVLPFLEGLRAKTYKKYARFFTRRFLAETTCRSCGGKRLRPEALCHRIDDKDIATLASWTLGKLRGFFDGWKPQGEHAAIAADVLQEIRSRLQFLCEVGVEYLSLDRPTRTLSGGESQRINLASALGANLVDALYVLDEPTVGMHARDTERLVATLRRLRDLGNTVLVIEHDLDVIAASDHLVDLGPGAGRAGGQVVFSGSLAAARGEPGHGAEQGDPEASRTIAHLRGEASVPIPETRRAPGKRWIEIFGVRRHNLREVDARIPLGLLVCVTGVSGSGKSTLVTDVLYKALTGAIPPGANAPYTRLRGGHLVRDVVLVDTEPIGRTPRSNPASYLKILPEIRERFAATPEARAARLQPGDFSFNTRGGRCESCEGMGWVQIEMHFMADLFVRCEHCDGQRFQPHVLGVRYRGRNIAEVLEMTVDEALTFFHDAPALGSKLYVLKRAGLGYLRLGQPAPTLSGGESQRLKIARALANKTQGNALYILDEPTNGLHPDDITRLLRTLQQLVDRGHSVLVIEHHLDFIEAADWVVDLGPEAGDGGGKIVHAGPPESLVGVTASWTGRCLQRHRQARRRPAPSAASS